MRGTKFRRRRAGGESKVSQLLRNIVTMAFLEVGYWFGLLVLSWFAAAAGHGSYVFLRFAVFPHDYFDEATAWL